MNSRLSVFLTANYGKKTFAQKTNKMIIILLTHSNILFCTISHILMDDFVVIVHQGVYKFVDALKPITSII